MLSERVNSPVLSAVDNSAVAALAVAAAQAGDGGPLPVVSPRCGALTSAACRSQAAGWSP